MKILVLGASGYVGSAVKKALCAEGFDAAGSYCAKKNLFEGDPSFYFCDITQRGSLVQLLNLVRPQVIFSCLRGDYAAQLAAHKTAAEFILQQREGRFFYFSTANVFDGDLSAPHFETDVPCALTEYGSFKIACEEMLRSLLGGRLCVLRLPEVWGRGCPRLLSLKEKIEAGEPVPVYENLYVNHSTDAQAAAWALFILKNGLSGVFHVGTRDAVLYEDFLRRLLLALGLPTPVFAAEKSEARCYQAIFPSRGDIPESLQLTSSQLIAALAAAPF